MAQTLERWGFTVLTPNGPYTPPEQLTPVLVGNLGPERIQTGQIVGFDHATEEFICLAESQPQGVQRYKLGQVLNAVRLRTDGTVNVCPDLMHRDQAGTFLESKSVGCTGHSIIYASRLRKDRDWCRAHQVQLYYAIWHHTCKVSGIACEWDLYEGLCTRLSYLVLLPHPVIYACARQHPLKMLNKKYSQRKDKSTRYVGYADRSKGYGIGYSIPLYVLQRLGTTLFTHRAVQVGRYNLAPFSVYTVREALGLFDEVPLWDSNASY
jgi:hypothetical protein